MAKSKNRDYLYNNQGGEESKIEVRVQKLARAWRKRMEAPLQKRERCLKLWASGFFDIGYQREHLINLMDRGAFTIVPYLVEGNPRILVETLIGNMRPYANTTQLALNFLIEKMNLADNVFIPIAINSIFGAGIARTFTEYNRTVNIDNEQIKSGTPVIRVIDDADYIGDVVARSRADYAYEGDVYKLPTKYARELFSKHADDIMPDCRLTTEYHPEKISNGDWDLNRLSLRDYTTFMDVYFYDEGVTRTIMPYGKPAKFLHEVEEDGPGGSPYDFLGYKFFPGTTYPIPPAWNWYDLDTTMNILARTAREQAESQKDLIFVPPGNKELGSKINTAKNLDILIAQNVEQIKKESLGGVNPENYNWMGFAENAFTKTGANPDVLGGRGAQAPTLGQEQMIHANASRIINNMYTRWHGFMESVIRKLAWRVWTNPTEHIEIMDEIPGVGELPVVFSSADKVGDYYDFVFKLIPYSTQRTSPEILYQKTMSFMAQWVLPTYQFAAQQGAQLDVPTVTRIMSDYLGLNNFNQYYRTAIPEQLDNINFQMQPLGGQRPKGADRQNVFNQTNDAFGALDSSREANLNQQQSRTSTQTPETGV
jgi:hypothetical protein